MFQSKNHPSRSRTLSTLLVPILGIAVAIACTDSPTQVVTDELAPQFNHKGTPHGKPGGGGDPSPPTATVVINTFMAGAGISGDDNPYPATLGTDGDLRVGADCPSGIELNLTGQGLAAPFNGVISTCAGGKGKSSASPRITVPELLGKGVGAILGVKTADNDPNYGNVTNYYFVVEKTGYNVVYWNGIQVTGIVDDTCLIDGSANPDGTRTYTLSTEPGLAGPGVGKVELRQRGKGGVPVLIADVEAHLEMTVTVTPCA